MSMGYMHIVDDSKEPHYANREHEQLVQEAHTLCGLVARLRPDYDRWRFLGNLNLSDDQNWCPKCYNHPEIHMQLLRKAEL